MAVIAIYWKKFFPINLEFYKKVVLGFLPSAIIGLVIKNKIDSLLTSVSIVAWALLIGGIVLIIVERYIIKKKVANIQISKLTSFKCIAIGLCQCLAFIPGVSRSASTIIGGLLFGLNKKDATEFSFFLAVPTLAGATLLKTLKIYPTIQSDQVWFLIIGLLLSFIFAIIAIRGFVSLVSRGVFQWFGIYRIILGATILIIM